MRRDGDGEVAAVVADEGAAGNAFGIKVRWVGDVATRCDAVRCAVMDRGRRGCDGSKRGNT
jgi:hypothetical protein